MIVLISLGAVLNE